MHASNVQLVCPECAHEWSAGGEAEVASDDAGELLLVIPRPGTISPWASKATDIAHNCGLSSVERIERELAWNHQIPNLLRAYSL